MTKNYEALLLDLPLSSPIHDVFTSYLRMEMIKKILLVGFIFVAIFHAIGILLPETGFDALWYHLPIVKDMAVSREIRIVPDVPQSDEPRLGEVMFLPFFVVGGVVGIKIFTFIVTLALMYWTYRLCQLYLPDSWSLLTTLLIFTFHTIAWEATSAYVDQIRALMEVGLLVFLLSKSKLSFAQQLIACVLLTASLLTKSVSVLFIPAWFVLLWQQFNWKVSVTIVGLSLFALFVTHPSFSIFGSASNQLIVQTGIIHYVTTQLFSFLVLPLTLSFHAESYMSVIFLFAVPFVWINRKWLLQIYRPELLFIAVSLFTWVWIVPVSVRYDLSGLILLTILCVAVVVHSFPKNKNLKQLFALLLVGNITLNMVIRVGAVVKALPFLLGRESEVEYIKQYDQGIEKGPIEKWYGIH
ncbi:hypothetical protein C5B42_01620 [Candidatus Cerribacteria bacterium 'Amazon FNV 2010 28 9']|uniref:Glycosyltransferase RgtA/B/C/D-like domain-containing protein n=1 Tax=Candidatus Cerribacteria bacterium 'Amazon FNV 2010 28 9' TaxID=2081795 RepID=A0A317JPP0_9BACT|nr:MAG: hypothetical protein C5B42_01620 [Candidatus Cerribacteria bacterium 'Amazon FNV 2010 28 9']